MKSGNQFNLNYVIKDYTSFVNYFFSLDKKTKDYIINEVYFYIYSNDNNKLLNKIVNMYNILLEKLKYNKLNLKERYIYEYVNEYLINLGFFCPNDLFEKYCSTYLNNISGFNTMDKIILLMQHILNEFNIKYNMDAFLSFNDDENCIAWMDFSENENVINVNLEKVNELISIKQAVSNYEELLSVCLFTILHEFNHLLQKNYMLKNNDNKKAGYVNDLFVINLSKLYDKYHNYFQIENESNLFGINNIMPLVSKSFKKKVDENEILEYINDLFVYYDKSLEKRFLIKYKLSLSYLKFLETFKLEPEAIKHLKKIFNDKK